MTIFVSAGLALQANMAHIKKPGWAEVPAAAGLPALPILVCSCMCVTRRWTWHCRWPDLCGVNMT